MLKLDVQNVSVEYVMKRSQARIAALREVSFAVEAGQFVTIVGPSGCGKTTLLNVMAGLLPATTGSIVLDGQAIQRPSRDRALVFQSPALLPWRTVIGNVTYGLELQGCLQARARSQTQRWIDLVGLQGFEESFPHV